MHVRQIYLMETTGSVFSAQQGSPWLFSVVFDHLSSHGRNLEYGTGR